MTAKFLDSQGEDSRMAPRSETLPQGDAVGPRANIPSPSTYTSLSRSPTHSGDLRNSDPYHQGHLVTEILARFTIDWHRG